MNISDNLREALESLVQSPGITLEDDVPLYSIDDHGFFVRTLNGVTVRGRFANGQFEEIEG